MGFAGSDGWRARDAETTVARFHRKWLNTLESPQGPIQRRPRDRHRRRKWGEPEARQSHPKCSHRRWLETANRTSFLEGRNHQGTEGEHLGNVAEDVLQ